MSQPPRAVDLEAYLDEALPAAEMARIEQHCATGRSFARAWPRSTRGVTRACTVLPRSGGGIG